MVNEIERKIPKAKSKAVVVINRMRRIYAVLFTKFRKIGRDSTLSKCCMSSGHCNDKTRKLIIPNVFMP